MKGGMVFIKMKFSQLERMRIMQWFDLKMEKKNYYVEI